LIKVTVCSIELLTDRSL